MSNESVLYDSPSELLHEVADSDRACAAQSVVPQDDGSYLCACSCMHWEAVVATREGGLQMARAHTATAEM